MPSPIHDRHRATARATDAVNPSLPQLQQPATCLSISPHARFFPCITWSNMPTLSRDIRSSIIVLALVLVPIIVLICVLAAALACSEFWSRPAASYFCCCRRAKCDPKPDQIQMKNLSAPRNSDSTEASGSSFGRFDYGEPAVAREHV